MNPTFQLIPIEQLKESPFNNRKIYNQQKLDELTESIRSKGILTPLLVRPNNGFYEIASGSRRYRAAKAIGLKEVPLIAREMTDAEIIEVIIIGNSGEDVHPLEEAEGYRTLMGIAGYDVAGIAAKVGKSGSYVYQRIKLSELVPEAKKLFLEDKITAGHAILIARLQEKEQTACAAFCIDRYQTPSVRDLHHFIENQIHLDLHAAAFKKDDANLLPEAGPCTTCSKRTGFNALLFPDIQKKDTCTDPTCYNAKIDLFVAAKIVKMQDDTDQPVLRLSSNYDDYESRGKKKDKKLIGSKPVYQKDYCEIGKKDAGCASARKGIIVEGDNRGKVLTVCADPECKTHHRKNRYGGEIDVKAKAREKAEKEKRKQEMAIRMKILDGILDNLPAVLDVEDLRFIAKERYHGLWHDFKKIICKRRDIEPGKGQYGGLDFDAKINKWIDTATPAGLYNFLMEMALIPDTQIGGYEKFNEKDDNKKDTLEEVAYRYQVDVIGIRERAKAEADGKKKKGEKLVKVLGKKKGKKPVKPKKTGKKPVKTRSGVCRVCGCTEENVCEEGCHWTDETRTLCSACEIKNIPCHDCANDATNGDGDCFRENFYDDGTGRLVCDQKKSMQTSAKKK